MKRIVSVLLLLSFPLYGIANTHFANRRDVKRFIHQMVKKHHFSKKHLQHIFLNTKIRPQVIKKIKTPYEAKPWYQYRAHFLTSQRINGGLGYWEKHQRTLNKVNQRFGVPAEIIISILGIESNYGTQRMPFRVIDALSNLAFNYSPRAPFFKKELEQYLLLCRDEHFNPLTVRGSYAGAIGQPQFIPSSYRHYAVGFKNKKHRDLINNSQDVMASIGNYLKANGWHRNEPVAIRATLHHVKMKQLPTSVTHLPPKWSIAKLKHLGISPKRPVAKQLKASLIAFQTKRGTQYWLTFNNFYVITRYNTSNQYAMAAYQLSAQIKQRRKAITLKRHSTGVA